MDPWIPASRILKGWFFLVCWCYLGISFICLSVIFEFSWAQFEVTMLLSQLEGFCEQFEKKRQFLEDGRTLPLGIPGKGEDEQERYQEGTGEEGQLSERVGWNSNPHLHTGVSFQVDVMKCEESAINVDLFELNLNWLSVWSEVGVRTKWDMVVWISRLWYCGS